MEINQNKSRLNHLWQIIILLVVNLIICSTLLYGLEFYLTLTDPKLKLPTQPVEVENKYGFREREFAVPKPPGVCRIMVLGDSFTWGKGVWVEERYTTLLETYLNQAYPYKKFEVLNFGFAGAPTTRERDSLRDYKDLVQPDLVVVGFVLNDPQPNRQNYSVERKWFEENYGESLDHTLERVEDLKLERTADLIRQAVDSFIVKIGLVPSWQVALQRVYEKDSTEWMEFEQALHDIKSMSDQMGLPQPIFAILNQGTYTDRPTDYSNPDEELELYLRWYHQAEEAATQRGFYSINYEREFAEQLIDEIIAVNVLDNHPSARVHRIYAQKLFKQITNYIETGQLCEHDFR
jgi:hypothetical protein